MKNILKIITPLLVVICCLPIDAFAQGGPPATPIDGGLSILLAAGGAYGLRKLAKARKEK